MDGHQYEHFCAKMLRKKGFNHVEVTKASGDQGIDIIAYKNGKKYGIQCKYYSSSVGNHAVQEVFAGAEYYDCDVAAVLTNNTFTKSAKELAQKTGVLLWEKGKVPLDTGGHFRMTKWMGIFTFGIGVVMLLMAYRFDNVQFPVLQMIEAVFLIVGGFLNIIENGKWEIELLAAFFYIGAFVLGILFHVMTKNASWNSMIIYMVFAFISFSRANGLFLKDNHMHMFKNRGSLFRP